MLHARIVRVCFQFFESFVLQVEGGSFRLQGLEKQRKYPVPVLILRLLLMILMLYQRRSDPTPCYYMLLPATRIHILLLL